MSNISPYTEDLINAIPLIPEEKQKFISVNSDTHTVSFTIQDGGVKDFGLNGCQITDVLEFVKNFIEIRAKQFPCRENSMTITKLDEALMWQNKRTQDRVKRAVEGQDKV